MIDLSFSNNRLIPPHVYMRSPQPGTSHLNSVSIKAIGSSTHRRSFSETTPLAYPVLGSTEPVELPRSDGFRADNPALGTNSMHSPRAEPRTWRWCRLASDALATIQLNALGGGEHSHEGSRWWKTGVCGDGVGLSSLSGSNGHLLSAEDAIQPVTPSPPASPTPGDDAALGRRRRTATVRVALAVRAPRSVRPLVRWCSMGATIALATKTAMHRPPRCGGRPNQLVMAPTNKRPPPASQRATPSQGTINDDEPA